MPLGVSQVSFSGKNSYHINMPPEANIIDVYVGNDYLHVAWMMDTPSLVPDKLRKFWAIPEWDSGCTYLDNLDCAYLGLIYWTVYSTPMNFSLNIDGLIKYVNYTTDGIDKDQIVEHFMIFEELQAAL